MNVCRKYVNVNVNFVRILLMIKRKYSAMIGNIRAALMNIVVQVAVMI
jgi:hypothetical protein